MSYIGATLNSRRARLFLPSERIYKLQTALQKFQPHALVTAHHAQHLLGLMASTTASLPHARLKMRSLQAWFLHHFDPMLEDPRKKILVTPELAKQLQWWGFRPHLLMGRPFRPLQLSAHVTTDASPTGWGAHCNGHTIHALWSHRQRGLHINHLEMLAVIKSFRAFLPLIESWCTSCNRQHHDLVLHQQAGWDEVLVPSLPCSAPVGVVLPPSHLPSGNPHTNIGEPTGRRAESPEGRIPRVGTGR